MRNKNILNTVRDWTIAFVCIYAFAAISAWADSDTPPVTGSTTPSLN